jgi:hypothetical protein
MIYKIGDSVIRKGETDKIYKIEEIAFNDITYYLLTGNFLDGKYCHGWLSQGALYTFYELDKSAKLKELIDEL